MPPGEHEHTWDVKAAVAIVIVSALAGCAGAASAPTVSAAPPLSPVDLCLDRLGYSLARVQVADQPGAELAPHSACVQEAFLRAETASDYETLRIAVSEYAVCKQRALENEPRCGGVIEKVKAGETSDAAASNSTLSPVVLVRAFVRVDHGARGDDARRNVMRSLLQVFQADEHAGWGVVFGRELLLVESDPDLRARDAERMMLAALLVAGERWEDPDLAARTACGHLDEHVRTEVARALDCQGIADEATRDWCDRMRHP